EPARRRGLGEEGAISRRRERRVGVPARRDALGLSLRRDPSPWAALELPEAQGGESAVDLRPVRRRHGHVKPPAAAQVNGSRFSPSEFPLSWRGETDARTLRNANQSR